jgi:hypothetical protein
MAFGFHRRQHRSKDGMQAAIQQLSEPAPSPSPRPETPRPPAAAATNGATGTAPAPVAAATGPRHLPLKEQASGSDARAERYFRQVRSEVDELRKAITERKIVDHQFADLDVAAVAANPEAAALIPSEVLVKAIIDLHEANERQGRRIEKLRAKNERLAERLQDLKRDRAFERGRLQTLDAVISALHANLEDLRFARDGELPLAGPREPRVLRPENAAPDALPPAENG